MLYLNENGPFKVLQEVWTLRYEIENEIFDRYPGYCRAVVIARNIDNTGEDDQLRKELSDCEEKIRNDPAMAQYKELPNIAAWRDIFRNLGLNPNKYPPSIANLVKRTSAGKDLPFINKLVTIFNLISLRHITPCGGDDLDVVTGSIRLGFASGNEEYVPLGQPDKVEHPAEGEVIYYDTGNNDVFCRVWCWKNGDRSKLMPETRNVAVNIEGMPPLERDQLRKIAEELALKIEKHCGGETEIHILSSEGASFEVEL